MSLPEEAAPLKDVQAYLEAIEELTRKIDAAEGDLGKLRRTSGCYMKQLDALQQDKAISGSEWLPGHAKADGGEK